MNLNKKSFRSKNTMRGFSMVELGLVLVVAVLALIGIIQAFSSNTIATQTDQLSGNLTTLVGKVKGAYANNYGQVSNARLSTGGFFRGLSALNNNEGVVSTNLGGGTLTVTPGTVTAANDSVQYVITQFPDEACLPFATAMARSTTSMTIGTNVVKAVGAAPDPSQIICTGDNNTITILIQ